MRPEDFFIQKGKRFFFTDPFAVAAYVRAHCPREAEGIVAAADSVADQRFMFTLRWDMERTNEPVIFDGDIDWLYQPGDDPEWVYAFNRMRFWICLGQAYALTRDEKYARAFARQMMHWVCTVKQDDPDCAKAWRSIEVGLRLEYWLKAIRYFQGSPAVTGEVIDVFIQSVTEQAEFIMGIWDTYNLMSNWGYWPTMACSWPGRCSPPQNGPGSIGSRLHAVSPPRSACRCTGTGATGSRAPCTTMKSCTASWTWSCWPRAAGSTCPR